MNQSSQTSPLPNLNSSQILVLNQTQPVSLDNPIFIQPAFQPMSIGPAQIVRPVNMSQTGKENFHAENTVENKPRTSEGRRSISNNPYSIGTLPLRPMSATDQRPVSQNSEGRKSVDRNSFNDRPLSYNSSSHYASNDPKQRSISQNSNDSQRPISNASILRPLSETSTSNRPASETSSMYRPKSQFSSGSRPVSVNHYGGMSQVPVMSPIAESPNLDGNLEIAKSHVVIAVLMLEFSFG